MKCTILAISTVLFVLCHPTSSFSGYLFSQQLPPLIRSTVFPLQMSSSTGSFGGGSGSPKNLKTRPLKEDNEFMERWNELAGLSERDIITNVGMTSTERRERSVTLAYRRCEYVTKLFSKTFYMGTSLMRPDARQHVWAIYAWCRRTDDIVDSPRALLNRDVLTNDLQDWDKRLDGIWSGQPRDLFDLAMVDTLKAYPRLSIQPFRDMIAGMVMDVPGLGKDRYQVTHPPPSS